MTLLKEAAVYQGEDWTNERKAEVVQALWASVSRPSGTKPSARRWGMKTPWAELDADVWDSLVNPVYIYVLRRGDRVFQSHIRSGYMASHSPERLISLYKDSLKKFATLRASGTAHLVQLDLAQDYSSRNTLVYDLFDFLGEKVDANVRHFVEEWPTHWSKPTSDPSEEPELPLKWRKLLGEDVEYQEMVSAYGY